MHDRRPEALGDFSSSSTTSSSRGESCTSENAGRDWLEQDERDVYAVYTMRETDAVCDVERNWIVPSGPTPIVVKPGSRYCRTVQHDTLEVPYDVERSASKLTLPEART